MKTVTRKKKYCGPERCPVDFSLEIIGGRWKGVIVYHLLSGTKRFGELRRLIPAATQRMITLQLRELEKDDLVKRKVYLEVPPKVEYSLTPLGVALRPTIDELMTWGARLQKMHHIPIKL
jgi:DNA-binding HxlR family transcriptional regulator